MRWFFSLSSPVEAPTPLLLDTFTAADGTDPTSRDLDAFPDLAGADRWRAVTNGVIQGNALVRDSIDAVLYVEADTPTVFAPFSNYYVVMRGDAAAGGYIRFVLYNADVEELSVQVDVGRIPSWSVYGEIATVPQQWSGFLPAFSAGSHTMGLYIQPTLATLIVDGVAVDSGAISPDWHTGTWNFARVDVQSSASALIDYVGIYNNVTLAQALTV